MTSLPEQCCTLPPFKSDYTPTGRRFRINVEGQEDLEVYTTGDADSKRALVCIYDIFGMHSNTLQGADHLAKVGGYRIVVPDFFRGAAWDPDNIPPREGRPVLNEWIQKVGSWERVRPGLHAVVQQLKSDGSTAIGAYGFCFGDPSFFQIQDAENISVPVALLPSQGEDKDVMNGFWEIIQKKPTVGQSVREDFLDVHHGFASARSDWSDARLAQRAQEAYGIMSKFFARVL